MQYQAQQALDESEVNSHLFKVASRVTCKLVLECCITTRRTAAKSSRGLLTTSGAATMRITANTSTTGTSPSVGSRLLARSSMSMRSPSWQVVDACSCCRTWRGRQRLAKVLRMRQRTPWTRRPPCPSAQSCRAGHERLRLGRQLRVFCIVLR